MVAAPVLSATTTSTASAPRMVGHFQCSSDLQPVARRTSGVRAWAGITVVLISPVTGTDS